MPPGAAQASRIFSAGQGRAPPVADHYPLGGKEGRRPVHPATFKLVEEILATDFQGIDPHREGGRLQQGIGQGHRRLAAETLRPGARQPVGKGGQLFQVDHGLGRIGPGDFFPLADEVAQNAVDEAGGPLQLLAPGQFHRFMHGGRGRHLVEKENLVSAEAQQIEHPRFDLGQRLAAQSGQGEVEPPAPTQGAVDQLGGQPPVAGIEVGLLLKSSVESEVGISPLIDPTEDGKSQLAGIGGRQKGILSDGKSQGHARHTPGRQDWVEWGIRPSPCSPDAAPALPPADGWRRGI